MTNVLIRFQDSFPIKHYERNIEYMKDHQRSLGTLIIEQKQKIHLERKRERGMNAQEEEETLQKVNRKFSFMST